MIKFIPGGFTVDKKSSFPRKFPKNSIGWLAGKYGGWHMFYKGKWYGDFVLTKKAERGRGAMEVLEILADQCNDTLQELKSKKK